MMTFLMSPLEMAKHIAEQARAKRLALAYTQQTLATRAGISLGVLKRFEHTGKISLESLLKLAVVLESLEGFTHVFEPPAPEKMLSLDQLLVNNTRKRGRL